MFLCEFRMNIMFVLSQIHEKRNTKISSSLNVFLHSFCNCVLVLIFSLLYILFFYFIFHHKGSPHLSLIEWMHAEKYKVVEKNKTCAIKKP